MRHLIGRLRRLWLRRRTVTWVVMEGSERGDSAAAAVRNYAAQVGKLTHSAFAQRHVRRGLTRRAGGDGFEDIIRVDPDDIADV
jgi:hypothetical protein